MTVLKHRQVTRNMKLWLVGSAGVLSLSIHFSFLKKVMYSIFFSWPKLTGETFSILSGISTFFQSHSISWNIVSLDNFWEQNIYISYSNIDNLIRKVWRFYVRNFCAHFLERSDRMAESKARSAAGEQQSPNDCFASIYLTSIYKIVCSWVSQ